MDSRVREIIDKSKKVVFFGGAGVSTESNIPFFMKHTETFYDYYKKNLIYQDAKPNKAHIALAELEKEGKLLGIVTQNIDGLHQTAGNTEVYELHGTISRAYCMKCGKEYPLEYTLDKDNWKEGTYTPLCECGGILKPDVVLYEEPLDNDIMMGALKAISEADTLIVGGTSLIVYPAAGLIQYFNGDHLILINKQETGFDEKADIVIHDSLGKVFSSVVDGIEFSEIPVPKK